jgi:hypothetical protein
MDYYLIIDVSVESNWGEITKRIIFEKATVLLVNTRSEIFEEFPLKNLEDIIGKHNVTGVLNLYDALNWVYYRILAKKSVNSRIDVFLSKQPDCDTESLMARTNCFKIDLKSFARQTQQKITSKLTMTKLNPTNVDFSTIDFSELSGLEFEMF